MAMQILTVVRATAPHLPTLAASLAPLLALANAGAAHLRYQNGAVIIEQGSFVGVDVPAVQAAVAAAPVDSPRLNAKAEIDQLPVYFRATLLLLLDQVNTLRTTPLAVLPAITEAQMWTAIKAKVDTLTP